MLLHSKGYFLKLKANSMHVKFQIKKPLFHHMQLIIGYNVFQDDRIISLFAVGTIQNYDTIFIFGVG